jgi:hypothetical protein
MQTYPAPLRPFVEQALRHHFEAQACGRAGYASGPGHSITAASCERAALLSLRASTCPLCQGTRVQTLECSARVIEIECLRCFGSGEVVRKVEPLPEGSTRVCPVCSGGSGRYRKRGSFIPGRHGRRWVDNAAYRAPCQGWFKRVGKQRVWHVNPDYDPDHELGWCVRCRGKGWLPCEALPAGRAEHRAGYAPSEDDSSSAVGAPLALMRATGQLESVLALEVAYGELGNYCRQRLGESIDLALWPLTRPGRLLLARLALPRGKRPHRALSLCRHSSEPLVASMAAVAQNAAVSALELALARHFAADAGTGEHTLHLSQRLRETG